VRETDWKKREATDREGEAERERERERVRERHPAKDYTLKSMQAAPT